jgi:hypothetical protein
MYSEIRKGDGVAENETVALWKRKTPFRNSERVSNYT